MRDNPEGLIDGYQAIRDQVGDNYKKAKALAPDLWDKMQKAPALEAAIATLVVNIWSWGHRMERGSVDQNRFAIPYYEVEPRILDASKLLQGVRITNDNYADLLVADADPRVVIFLDPPYDDCDDAYTDKVDHEKLTIDLMDCRCSWMITHSRSEMFKARALALRRRMRSSVFMLEEYEANTKNDDLPRPELVITNYDPQSDFWAWLRDYAGFSPQGFTSYTSQATDKDWKKPFTDRDRMDDLETALKRARAGHTAILEKVGNDILTDAKKRR